MAEYNRSNVKTPASLRDASARIKDFLEVSEGYTEAEALLEANRCLGCKDMPCVKGCPVNIEIPKFIKKIKENDVKGAYEVITLSSSLPAICGRVCPQEVQCEAKCVRGINGEPVAIGRLERFVADSVKDAEASACPVNTESAGKRVALIGSGPSSLACAADLAKLGYKVTVYEALHELGGVLTYGIPEFRLPKSIVKSEIEKLEKLGVCFETNVIIGKTLTVFELFDMGYEAVFIGSGAGLPSFMGIPGEGLKGVYSANEFLTRVNLMKAYRNDPVTPVMKGGTVAVVGGGNVAMDAARCALRLGADKVMIVYRRSMDELPARREEVEHAEEEGIEFCLLTNPTRIIGYENKEDPRDPKNGFVKAIECVKMELGAPDERGRRRPVEVKGSEFLIDTDTVIISIGTTPNPLIKSSTDGLEVTSRGCITVEEGSSKTSIKGVFAGGDAVTGAATVISAMGAGRLAAREIDEYLKNK